MNISLRSWSTVVIFAAVIAVCHSQQQLEIIPGSDQYLEEGSLFSFTCESIGTNKYEYPIWIDPQGNQVYDRGSGGSQERYTEQDGKFAIVLFFDNIQENHAGSYSCRAGSLSKTVSVQIYKGIEFEDAEEEQFLTVGEEGFITCVVTGNPMPTVQWKFNDEELPNDGRFTPMNEEPQTTDDPSTRYVPKAGTGLGITDVALTDEGTYTCRARMPTLGYTRKVEIFVDVLVPPVITQGPQNTTGDEGKSARFTCHADGDPLPVVVWYFHDTPVENPIKYQIGENGRTLSIQNLEESDGGKYDCRAENRVAFVTDSAHLTVNVIPVLGPSQNETRDEDDFVSFTCMVIRGTPFPTLRWKRGIKYYELGEQPDDNRINVNFNSQDQELVLTINNLNRFDIGVYTCEAENVAGTDERDSLLDVYYEPVIEETKTLSVQKSWRRNPTNITCVIMSNPTAEYKWDRNPWPLNRTDHRVYSSQFETSLFIIPDRFNDFGDYRCSAENRLGYVRYVVTLEETFVPDVPKKVESQEIFPDSIILRVMDPENTGGWPIDGYKVGVRQGEFGKIENQFFVKGETIDVKGLKVNTAYQVMVSCHNPVGYSLFSEAIIFETLDYRHPYAPIITSAPTTQMGTKYNLQWITPKDGGMEIRFYELKYRELFFAEDGSPQGSGFWKDKSGIPNYSTDYLIEDLKPETSYDVELLAINSIGRGDVAALTISTGRTAPTVGPTKPRLVDYTIKPGPQIGTAALTTGAIIGIVIAIFFLLLIIVDVTCYCMNDCGILMCLCVNLCGKTPVGEKDMEEGRTKVPPSDDQIPDGTPVKGDDMPMEKIETDGDSTEKPPPEDSFDSEGKEEDVHNYEELKEEEPEPLESDHLLTDKDNPEERKESNETGDDEKESLLKGKDQNNPDAKPAEVQRENPALTPDQEPKKGPEDYEVSREADLNDIDMDVKKEVQA